MPKSERGTNAVVKKPLFLVLYFAAKIQRSVFYYRNTSLSTITVLLCGLASLNHNYFLSVAILEQKTIWFWEENCSSFKEFCQPWHSQILDHRIPIEKLWKKCFGLTLGKLFRHRIWDAFRTIGTFPRSLRSSKLWKLHNRTMNEALKLLTHVLVVMSNLRVRSFRKQGHQC